MRRAASVALSRARWVLLAMVAALAALTLLPANMVTVQECVTVPKGAGWLGVHFALLRESSACSTGSYAVGGETDAVLGIALMVAVPILLINICAAVFAIGFSRIVSLALNLVRKVLAAVFPQLPIFVVQIVQRLTQRVDRELESFRPQLFVSPVTGRGPPALAVV